MKHSCRFCGRETDSGHGNTFHENHCKENPSREELPPAWNKGTLLGIKHASCHGEVPENLLDLSSRTVSKVLLRLKKPCSHCGWYVEGAVGDLNHIIPKAEGGTDTNDNLTYICPNCHRLYHSGLIKREEFISLVEYIGDEWKKFVYYK